MRFSTQLEGKLGDDEVKMGDFARTLGHAVARSQHLHLISALREAIRHVGRQRKLGVACRSRAAKARSGGQAGSQRNELAHQAPGGLSVVVHQQRFDRNACPALAREHLGKAGPLLRFQQR